MEGGPLLRTPAAITRSAASHVTQRTASNIDDVAVAVGGAADVRVRGCASASASVRGSGTAGARGRGSVRGSVRGRMKKGEGSDNDGRGGD